MTMTRTSLPADYASVTPSAVLGEPDSPATVDSPADDESPARPAGLGQSDLPPSANTALESIPRHRSRRRLLITALIVLVGFVCSVGAVIFGIGPLVYARDQRNLMTTERASIAEAAVEENGLGGVHLPSHPPVVGNPVGILAIPALGTNQAVIEGVGSSQTVSGPGHVPGTAGLGQRGNSVVVGRNTAYGGPFGRIDQLKRGDRILTATVEGQTIYTVRSVRTVTLDTVYGPTADNQLTLITSATTSPFNSSLALEVTARMSGKPYVSTPRGPRSPSQQGNTGDSGAWAQLSLALLALVATAVGAVFLYRRCTVRSAYLLSTAPLLAVTVLAAESISRLLPAWM